MYYLGFTRWDRFSSVAIGLLSATATTSTPGRAWGSQVRGEP